MGKRPQGEREGVRAKKHFPHRQEEEEAILSCLTFKTGCLSKHDKWLILKKVTSVSVVMAFVNGI